jgi:hypothetical protein
MDRTRSVLCARAAIGQVAIAAPKSLMNSRRLNCRYPKSGEAIADSDGNAAFLLIFAA